MTSWAPEHSEFVSACRESVAYLPKYQDLARELNINIIPGTICEAEDGEIGADERQQLLTSSPPGQASSSPLIRSEIFGTQNARISSRRTQRLTLPSTPHSIAATANPSVLGF